MLCVVSHWHLFFWQHSGSLLRDLGLTSLTILWGRWLSSCEVPPACYPRHVLVCPGKYRKTTSNWITATSICIISKSVRTTSWSLYPLQSFSLTDYCNKLQTHANFPKQTNYDTSVNFLCQSEKTKAMLGKVFWRENKKSKSPHHLIISAHVYNFGGFFVCA
jgi:hypothetical protein